MTRFEQNYYNDISSIEKSLKRIANALENNNKEDKIYYKTRKDMFMDNPCTKEEYDAAKQDRIQEQEELDTQHDYLHQLVKNLSGKDYAEFCNEHCLPTADSVAVSNYITDLDYHEVLSIISDIEVKSNLQSIVDLALNLPSCLLPIFILGVPTDGASQIPLEELPITKSEYFIIDR